jgi:hypothetical protein
MVYSFTINLSESEAIALKAAIEHYQGYCVAAQKDGPVVPYFAQALSLEDVMKKLEAETTRKFNEANWNEPPPEEERFW